MIATLPKVEARTGRLIRAPEGLYIVSLSAGPVNPIVIDKGTAQIRSYHKNI
jgi:hypothetical protein